MAALVTDALPRRALAFLPTPLHALERLSHALGGPRLFVKRDDQTGLALGGNKARKLEFLIGAALAEGANSVITGGAAQSNHCRQTAAAAAAVGLDCHLVLGGEAPAVPEGNLLLDNLFGATLHFCGERRRGEDIPRIAEQLRAAGGRPYVLPYGGSSAQGAAAFTAALAEAMEQARAAAVRFDRIVFASSSGGTHAGLAVGARLLGFEGEILGIGIDKWEGESPGFAARVAALCNELSALIAPGERFVESDLRLDERFTGGGYGVVGALERGAIHRLAAHEGILLDPVYTGRAFGALLALIGDGTIGRDETVLFWHTGGAPALFVHAGDVIA